MDITIIIGIISGLLGIGAIIFTYSRTIKNDSGENSMWKGRIEQRIVNLENKNKEQDARMDKIDNALKEGLDKFNQHLDTKVAELKQDWDNRIKELINVITKQNGK